MTAVWAWVLSELRRRPASAIALTLLIGVSLAVALTAVAGARRTATAFDRFIERSRTADIQLQYSVEADVDDDVLVGLRDHPDIELAEPVYLTVAFVEGSDLDVAIFAGPSSALFQAVDRPRIVEGRAPDPDAEHEVIITRFVQRTFDVEVGELVPFGTFSAEEFDGEDVGETGPSGPTLDLRIVGVAVTPYDLADPEFAGVFATPAFFRANWGVVGGFGPMIEIATSGPREPIAVVEEAISGFELEEILLTSSDDLVARTRDGTHVLAAGLGIFAAVAGMAAVVAMSLLIHRRMVDASRDLPALASIGLPRAPRILGMILCVAPLVVAGTVLAGALAVLASPFMPIGAARSAEPDPGFDTDVAAIAGGALVLGSLLLVLCIAGAWQIARRSGRDADDRSAHPARGRVLAAALSPPGRFGVSMALDRGGRGRMPMRTALVGAAVGVTGLVAAVTFGVSLDTLVDDPPRWGWNWTVAPDVPDAGLEDILAVPGVGDVGRLEHRQVVVEGAQLLGVAMDPVLGSPSLTVTEGRMPVGPNEIAVGPALAERSDWRLGDTVDVADETPAGSRSMRIVGEVLFPTFDENPFNDGVAVDPDVIDELAVSEGFSQVVVRFEEGISTEQAAARLSDEVTGSVSLYSLPSPPPDVLNLEGVRFLPFALCAFLGLLALAAVTHAVATSVSNRRHDFGIVRSLGFVRRDVTRAVATQSVTLAVVGLVIGMPLGVVIGRRSWSLVAEQLGVASDPSLPALAYVVVAVGAVTASVLVAILPAHAAARRPVAEVLRTE